MREIFWHDGRAVDAEPVPVKDAAVAAAGAVRLAWSARPGAVLGVVVLNAATASAELAQVLWSGAALEAAVGGERPRAQTRRLVAMGALKLFTIAGRDVSQALQSQIGQAVSRQAEGKVLDIVGALELADVEDPAFQDGLQQALMASGRHAPLVTSALGLSGVAAGLVTAVAAMGSSDRALIPLAVLGAAPQYVLSQRLQDPMRAMRHRSREGRETMVLRHYLTGPVAAHELRAFGSTSYVRNRHDELTDRSDRAMRDVERASRRRAMITNLAGSAAVVPAAARLVLRLGGKQSSLGGSFSGGLAARQLSSGLGRLVNSVSRVRSIAAVTDAYADFVATPPPAPRPGPTPDRQFERITVQNLGFTYPGSAQPVLHGVDLEIRRGEVVALVGENGCGKTTLAKLLCCLYRPTSGTIRWDDIDIADCDPAAVRAGIAVVFQDFVRYPSLTAAENIGIGQPSRVRDREAIIGAARQAGAHDVISALPDGYDTMLSRNFGGVDLSAGQWQRVALARAFLRDAPLVVLDEPTAALDPRAERDLFETVASLYRSRSALLISHRLSSVRFADRICVLAGGRITESGTHEQLLAEGGTYAELFELQAHAYR